MVSEAAHPGVDTDPSLVDSAVSDPFRRRVLRVLQDVGAELSITDLATELVRRETDDRATGDAGPGEDHWEQVRQYHVLLFHAHAPKLAAAGLVDFDVDRKAVAPLTLPADVEARVDGPGRPT